VLIALKIFGQLFPNYTKYDSHLNGALNVKQWQYFYEENESCGSVR